MKIILTESQVMSLSEKIKVQIEKGEAAKFNWEAGDIADAPKVHISLTKLYPNQPLDDEKYKDYQDKVDGIIAKYKKNKSLMPIFVHKIKRGYRIIDGHHRWTALKQMGKKTAECIVVPAKDVKYVKSINEKEELCEKCWPGYTQKGMKTMFGKRYPNCVKKTK